MVMAGAGLHTLVLVEQSSAGSYQGSKNCDGELHFDSWYRIVFDQFVSSNEMVW